MKRTDEGGMGKEKRRGEKMCDEEKMRGMKYRESDEGR